MPHVPQLLLSLCVFVHTPLQIESPSSAMPLQSSSIMLHAISGPVGMQLHTGPRPGIPTQVHGAAIGQSVRAVQVIEHLPTERQMPDAQSTSFVHGAPSGPGETASMEASEAASCASQLVSHRFDVPLQALMAERITTATAKRGSHIVQWSANANVRAR